MITKNQVLTIIREAVKTEYPDIFVTSDRIYATSNFPCLEIIEIYRKPTNPSVNLTDTPYVSTFEVQAYSNKESGGREEVYDIISVCETAFAKIGYLEVYSQPTENTKEITIKRHIARFTRVICSNDTI